MTFGLRRAPCANTVVVGTNGAHVNRHMKRQSAHTTDLSRVVFIRRSFRSNSFVARAAGRQSLAQRKPRLFSPLSGVARLRAATR
jgi:hypothetical protein